MAVNTLAQASSSPLQRILRDLTGPERARAAGMIGFIGALHIVGWGLLLMVAGGHHQAGAWAFGIGTVALVGIIGIFRRMRHGDHDEATLEEQLANRGLLNRILGRVMRAITKPWQTGWRGVRRGFRHGDRGRATDHRRGYCRGRAALVRDVEERWSGRERPTDGDTC